MRTPLSSRRPARVARGLGIPWRDEAVRIVAVLVAALGATAGAAEESTGAPEGVLETRVSARAERAPARGDRRAPASEALASATPEDALEALAGVSLARDGGPLAPSRVLMRGLTGPRVRVDVGGLSLGDPVTGELDPALLPLFAAASLVEQPGSGTGALGGSLSLEPAESYFKAVRARLGVGTLSTLRADVLVGTPTPDGGHVTLAVQAGSTEGDFVYRPFTRSGGPAAKEVVRTNNDQRRASALLSARTYAGPLTFDVTAFGAAHEGGIPGFATAPTDGLRGQRAQAGATTKAALDLGDARASLRAQGSVASRRVLSPRQRLDEGIASALQRLEGELALPAIPLPATAGLDVTVIAGATHAALLDDTFSRTSALLRGRVTTRVLSDWLLVDLAGGAEGHSDVGLIPEGHLALELGRPRTWAVGALFSHGGRAPSLDELYAPRGLVLGNPELTPERSTDLEVYGRLRGGRLLDARIAAFAGHMGDAILFLNRNAFEIRPINTGPVVRAGLEGRVAVTPHELVGLELTTSLLASRMEVTGAPLPTVPPLFARLSTRLGLADDLNFTVVMRHREDTPSTLYGTLPVPGYTLFDAVLRLPLGPHLAATAALTNVFDVKTAQDVNLLPLPGRQLFCALEVRHE